MLFCAPFSSSGHGVGGGSDEEVPAWIPPPLPAKAKWQHISIKKTGGQSCTLNLSPGCYFYTVGSSITGMFSPNE